MNQVFVTGFGLVSTEHFEVAMRAFNKTFADLAGKNMNARMMDAFEAFSKVMVGFGHEPQS